MNRPNGARESAQILLPLLFFPCPCIRDCRTDLAQNRGMKAKTQDLDLPAAVALRKKIGPSLAKRHSEVSEGRIETVMGGVHGVNLNVIFVYNCAIHQVRARRLHILETLSLCP